MSRRKGGFRAANNPVTAAQKNELLSAIQGDENIDEVSRAEMIAKLNRPGGAMYGGEFNQIKSTLGEAQEGTNPLYAGRQLQKRTTQVMKEQPGRQQTILSRSV